MPTHAAAHARVAGQPSAHAFRGLDDWIDVFFEGTHTDSQGRQATFSRDDLLEMVGNVAGAGVPWVIGHPDTEHRAFAWSKPGEVRLHGNVLQVRGSDINAEFRALVDDGAYRERSLKIYRDPQRGWTIRHIGWLGAAPPALQLSPLSYEQALPDGVELREFAAGDDIDVAWAFDVMAQTLRALRDWMIAGSGVDAADKVLPDWRITSLADTAARLRASAIAEEAASVGEALSAANAIPSGAYVAPSNQGAATMPSPATDAALAQQIEAARAEGERAGRAAAEATYAAQADELRALRLTQRAERFAAKVEKWRSDEVVSPALAAGMVEFMAAIDGGDAAQSQAAEFAFSATDGKPAKTTPVAWFSAFVDGLGALLRLGKPRGDAGAGSGADTVDTGNYRELADAASEYQAAEAAKGRAVSIAAAVAHVAATRAAA